jgi:hypothetical protein
MTVEDLKALFEKHDNEFLKSELIASPRSKRPDLNAFLLLDELVPTEIGHYKGHGFDMVAGAEHDEIFLEPSVDKLAAVITEDQVIELIRCGIRMDADGLRMYA